jgi:hypothetical protein
MVFNITKEEQAKIDGATLEQVPGVTLTTSNDSTTKIKCRLMLAFTVLGKLQRIWTDGHISQRTKLNALVYQVGLFSMWLKHGPSRELTK